MYKTTFDPKVWKNIIYFYKYLMLIFTTILLFIFSNLPFLTSIFYLCFFYLAYQSLYKVYSLEKSELENSPYSNLYQGRWDSSLIKFIFFVGGLWGTGFIAVMTYEIIVHISILKPYSLALAIGNGLLYGFLFYLSYFVLSTIINTNT